MNLQEEKDYIPATEWDDRDDKLVKLGSPRSWLALRELIHGPEKIYLHKSASELLIKWGYVYNGPSHDFVLARKADLMESFLTEFLREVDGLYDPTKLRFLKSGVWDAHRIDDLGEPLLGEGHSPHSDCPCPVVVVNLWPTFRDGPPQPFEDGYLLLAHGWGAVHSGGCKSYHPQVLHPYRFPESY